MKFSHFLPNKFCIDGLDPRLHDIARVVAVICLRDAILAYCVQDVLQLPTKGCFALHLILHTSKVEQHVLGNEHGNEYGNEHLEER